jgi:uracil-DNA glycosylase
MVRIDAREPGIPVATLLVDPVSDRKIRLQPQWLKLLRPEFDQPYMQELSAFLRSRRASGAEIFPPPGLIFNAFWQTPPERVRVVILGQDPYHNPGQAHGLCFSVSPGVTPPPSLVNIFRELRDDLGCVPPGHGCLQHWAEQGVLLLNTVLTVERNSPGSHQGRGWELFTDRVVELLNERAQPIVFLLWGSQAQKKGRGISPAHHCVLRAPHPSPLSAHRGFLGCRHFSAANKFLEAQGQAPIDWQLPAEAHLAVAGTS